MTEATSEKILIALAGGAADFFKAQSRIRAVLDAHPAASCSLLVSPALADMARRSRLFADVIPLPDVSAFNIPAQLALYRSLKRAAFDGVYTLARPLPFAARQALAGVPARVVAAAPDVAPPVWMETDVSLFGLQKPYVLLLPGQGAAWPAVRYAAAAMKLIRQGCQVAILGTDADADIARRVCAAAPEVKDITGRTSYYDVYSLARGAEGMIGAPSAALHLAAMAGCPVVALLDGAADLQKDTPEGDAVTVIQADTVADISVEDVLRNLRPRPQQGDAA